MNYSGTRVKLIDKVCDECKSGPADGSWEFKALRFGKRIRLIRSERLFCAKGVFNLDT